MRRAASATLVGIASCIAAPVSNAQTEAIEEIVVRESRYGGEISLGGKVSEERRRVPASLSVVTEQRIADQKFATVADALTTVTGVTVVSTDGLTNQYRSRGHELSLMSDGIPIYGAFSSFQQLDLAVYERLEVLRGPNGLLQGAGAPSGSVNLVTKRGRERFTAAAELTAGAWDYVRSTIDVTGPIAGHSRLRGRLVGVYEQREHFADRVDFERTVGYGSLDWELAPSTTLGLSFAEQSDGGDGIYYGLPSYESGALLDVPRSTSVSQAWARHDWDTSDNNVQLVHSFAGSWRITARWWQRDQRIHRLDALTSNGVRDSDSTVPFVRRDFDNSHSRQGFDLFATGSFALLGRMHGLLVGYNDDQYHFRTLAVQRIRPTDEIRVPFDRSDLVPVLDAPYEEGGETKGGQSGLYVQARFSLAERARLIAGGRVSDLESRSRSISLSNPAEWRSPLYDDHATPMAAIVIDVAKKWSVYGSYTDAFVPQSTQLRADGEPLEPRIGKQYELGTKADWLDGAFQTSVAIFDLSDTGRALMDAASPGFFVNAGEVQSKGWEAEVVGSPAPQYEVQIGYSRLDAQFVVAPPDQQGDRFSSMEPRHSWKTWAVRRFDLSTGGGLTIGGGFVAQSGTEFEPPRSQGWYTVFTAMVGYRFNERMALNLNVSNLLDEHYYTRFGPISGFNMFGEPRNVLLTARATF